MEKDMQVMTVAVALLTLCFMYSQLYARFCPPLCAGMSRLAPVPFVGKVLGEVAESGHFSHFCFGTRLPGF